MSLTPAQIAFLARARRRMLGMEPDVIAAILKAWRTIIEQLNETELAALIRSGSIEQVVASVANDELLDAAFAQVREQMRRNLVRSFNYARADTPKGGMVNGVLSVQFDYLSPHVVAAIQRMESVALSTLKADIRDTVRYAVELGIERGQAPRTIARGLRSVIGLAKNQAQYVANLRAELESGQYSAALRRVLIDKRFNLDKLASLSDAERAKRIDTIVSQYEKRWIAQNANVNAKAMTTVGYKQGQRLAWMDAQAKGAIPPGYVLTKQWWHLDAQPDPRPTHEALGRLAPVPADQPYVNGDMVAGESSPWNCKCLDIYRVARAA